MLLAEKLTKATLEELKSKGHTFAHIAEMYKVSPTSITKLAKNTG